MSADDDVPEDPTLTTAVGSGGESAPVQADDDGVEVECPICYCEYPKAETRTLRACQHVYCQHCIRQLATTELNTGMLVKCPNLSCQKELPPEELAEQLSQEQLRSYSVVYEQTMNARAAEAAKQKHGMIYPSQDLVAKFVGFVHDRDCVAAASDTDFFHYTCFNETDGGWGCAYRCLQMIVSNLLLADASLRFRADPAALSCGYAATTPPHDKPLPERWQPVPSLREIQTELAALGRLRAEDVGTTKWIEPPDAACFLRRWGLAADDREYHLIEPDTVADLHRRLVQHFDTQRTPVMFDDRIKAYCIVAIKRDKNQPDTVTHLLRFDPHVFIYPTTPGQWGPKGVEWLPFKSVFSQLSKWLLLFPTRQRTD